MEIKTKACGTVEINQEDVITFETGLLGFEKKSRYVLLGSSQEDDVLLWLQSIEDEDLAFVVIQPRFFRPEYQPEIHAIEIRELEADDPAAILLYAIVVVPEDIRQMTVNLRAPIVINTKNNKAKQVVLNDEKYKIKEYIFAGK